MEEPFINHLPNELLTWIFEITPRGGDWKQSGYTAWHRRLEYYPWLRFMLVCQRWRMVGERLLYRRMSLKIGDELSESMALVTEKPHICSFINDLHLGASLSKPVEKSTLDLLSKFNSVRKLNVRISPDSLGRPLLQTIGTMPLTQVSLDRPSPDMVFEFFGHPTLTSLWVTWLDSSKSLNLPTSGIEKQEAVVEEERGSEYSPSSDPSMATKALDELLPPSRHRTSNINFIYFSMPSTSVDVAQRLFMWPACLEEARICFLSLGDAGEDYTSEGVERLLAPQSDCLKKIEIGVLTGQSYGIPDFSRFVSLEKLTISAYDLFHESPERAYQKISAPALKRLEISFATEEGKGESLNAFGENELYWLVEFIEFVKTAHQLRNIYIRFQPQPTYPPRDDVSEWPWDMFEELAELAQEHRINIEYDPPEWSKRDFSERYQTPLTEDESDESD